MWSVHCTLYSYSVHGLSHDIPVWMMTVISSLDDAVTPLPRHASFVISITYAISTARLPRATFPTRPRDQSPTHSCPLCRTRISCYRRRSPTNHVLLSLVLCGPPWTRVHNIALDPIQWWISTASDTRRSFPNTIQCFPTLSYMVASFFDG